MNFTANCYFLLVSLGTVEPIPARPSLALAPGIQEFAQALPTRAIPPLQTEKLGALQHTTME
jgi:hypothetical protein